MRFIGNQFRKPSGFFGKIISCIMVKGNSAAYDKIIRELAIEKHDKILEIGYGHGIGINKISSLYDCTITGIDFSDLMRREATKRNKKHIHNKRVVLLYGDFLSADLGSNSFNKIFCLNVIYFWNNLNEPFAKIYEGLMAEGKFCLYMAHRATLEKMKFTKDDIFNKYSLEEVVDCLELSGFKDVECKYDKGYHIVCRKQTGDVKVSESIPIRQQG